MFLTSSRRIVTANFDISIDILLKISFHCLSMEIVLITDV